MSKRTTVASKKYIKAIIKFNVDEIQKSIAYDETQKAVEKIATEVIPQLGAFIGYAQTMMPYDMFKPWTYRLSLTRHKG